jgi:hypothetical protein
VEPLLLGYLLLLSLFGDLTQPGYIQYSSFIPWWKYSFLHLDTETDLSSGLWNSRNMTLRKPWLSQRSSTLPKLGLKELGKWGTLLFFYRYSALDFYQSHSWETLKDLFRPYSHEFLTQSNHRHSEHLCHSCTTGATGDTQSPGSLEFVEVYHRTPGTCWHLIYAVSQSWDITWQKWCHPCPVYDL